MKYATEEAFVGANAFGKGAANTAYAQYFVGNSYLNPLTDPQVTALHLSNVTFEVSQQLAHSPRHKRRRSVADLHRR